MPENETITDLGLEEYKYGFVTEGGKPVFKARPGLDEDIVREISAHKDEPQWMLDFRLKALAIYRSKPMPSWGGDLSQLDRTLDEIYYYLKPQEKMERSWDDVPQEIKDTFEKLGIPEAERKVLAGVGAQYESEMVYHSLKKEWEDKGILFESIEDGLKEVSRHLPRAFRHGGADIGQQVRGAEFGGVVGRLVRVHPEGCEGRHPAAGVFPRERGEDGAVRAHADHRR